MTGVDIARGWHLGFLVLCLSALAIALIAAAPSGWLAPLRSLLTGLHQPWAGELLLDGVASSELPAELINNSLAAELGKKGITCVVLHPGWVQTRMGGEAAPVKPVDSVAGLVAVIAGLDAGDNGRFYDYQGKELPW